MDSVHEVREAPQSLEVGHFAEIYRIETLYEDGKIELAIPMECFEFGNFSVSSPGPSMPCNLVVQLDSTTASLHFDWALYLEGEDGMINEYEPIDPLVMRPVWYWVEDPAMSSSGDLQTPHPTYNPGCIGSYSDCRYFVWGPPEKYGELDIGFWHVDDFKDGGSWFEQVTFAL